MSADCNIKKLVFKILKNTKKSKDEKRSIRKNNPQGIFYLIIHSIHANII